MSRLVSWNLFSSSLRGGAEGRYLFCVCVVGHFMFCCLYYYFLDYLVLCVCIYGGRGGMHDTELLGEKRFCWAWSVK